MSQSSIPENFPKTAIVTGGRSGIGAAVVAQLEAGGTDVRVLDLADGFDVGDAAAWDEVEPAELVVLNAGRHPATPDSTKVDLDLFDGIISTNIGGNFYAVRSLAPRMEPGGAFVSTSSVAGLFASPRDPLYALTKHAIVGWVRSVAPLLQDEYGLRIHVVCPIVVDTPFVPPNVGKILKEQGVTMLQPEDVADAILGAARADDTGQAWFVRTGVEPERFVFPEEPEYN